MQVAMTQPNCGRNDTATIAVLSIHAWTWWTTDYWMHREEACYSRLLSVPPHPGMIRITGMPHAWLKRMICTATHCKNRYKKQSDMKTNRTWLESLFLEQFVEYGAGKNNHCRLAYQSSFIQGMTSWNRFEMRTKEACYSRLLSLPPHPGLIRTTGMPHACL